MNLSTVDWLIMAVYFVFVLGIGFVLKRQTRTSEDFFEAGKSLPAMVFVGLFMMPFYYSSRARSVPECLRLRFDEKTRALNAITFACMTVLSSGVSMYAMAKLIQTLRIDVGHLQRGSAVLPDRGRLLSAGQRIR